MNNSLLKQQLKEGKTIIFDNKNTMADDFRSAECTFKNEPKNTWANGFKIDFNGAHFSFKTFSAFRNKLNILIVNFNLQLKS